MSEVIDMFSYKLSETKEECDFEKIAKKNEEKKKKLAKERAALNQRLKRELKM